MEIPANQHQMLLSIDVGATSIKAALTTSSGEISSAIHQRKTNPPISPSEFVTKVGTLAGKFPSTTYGVVGFPGDVVDGVVLAPDNLVATLGPGSAIDVMFEAQWIGYSLARDLSERLQRIVVVANDADIAALGCATGTGRELTVTLGTGIGMGLVVDGQLQPHQEFPFLDPFGDLHIDEVAGERARKTLDQQEWNARVLTILAEFITLTNCDRCFVTGGNARRVRRDSLGELPVVTWVVAEPAGLLGAARLIGQH